MNSVRGVVTQNHLDSSFYPILRVSDSIINCPFIQSYDWFIWNGIGTWDEIVYYSLWEGGEGNDAVREVLNMELPT